MIERRTGLPLLLVVLVLLVAYGVVSNPEPRPVAVVGPVDAFECSLTQGVGGSVVPPSLDQLPVPRPARGTVPDAFAPVEAVVCDSFLGDRVTADGTATYFEHHYAGDFESIIKELNTPSARRSVFPAMCGDYSLPATVDMWLVDADGRAVEPSYPVNDCGFDNTLGLFEIESLAVIDSVEHRVQIDTAGILTLYGCSSVMSPSTPGPLSLFDISIDGLGGFCRFDTSGFDPVFLGAETYGAESGPDLSGGLRDLAPAGQCTDRATSLATTLSTGSIPDNPAPVEVVVELDGCRRVLADGYLPLAAPADFVAAIARGAV